MSPWFCYGVAMVNPLDASLRILLRTVLLVASLSSVAKADALPPDLPIKCPTGSKYVNDHGGSRCVADAPTDCPAGWVGLKGGKCVLDLCAAEDRCGPELQCKRTNLCVTEGMGYQFGAAESTRSPLFGEPPAARWLISYADACSEARTCQGNGKCVTSKVCLPAGVQRPASRPANAAITQRVGERGAPLPAATA
jgi:hypothetical protein